MPMLDRTHRDDGDDGFSEADMDALRRCLARRSAGLRWQTDQMLERASLECGRLPPRRRADSDIGTLWNVRGLVRFRSGEFDSLCPVFGISGDKGPKFV
jgi:hypothetical protein